jgi:regulator of RNase E activity RraA
MNQVTDDQILRMRRYSTAIVTDGLKRLGLRDAWAKGIRPVPPNAPVFAGRAVVLTYAPKGKAPAVSLPGQFTIINQSRPGDVLVYAACGVDAWLVGDNVVNLAMHRKLGAVVVDGGVRDVQDLRKLDFPTYAKTVSASPYSLEVQLVSIDTPATIAGATVAPGDLVVGDADGVVVVPAAAVEELLFEIEHLAEVDAELGRLVVADAPLAELERVAAQKGQRRPRTEPAK